MAEGLERGEGEYTKNGSVDLKGNPVLRSKRGGWTACFFVVVYELVERMAYYGIASNLVLYLTDKLHQGTVTAANNVTNWVGTVFLTPILGAYVADAHLGRYWTFVTGSAIYLVGMCLLTLAVSLPSLKPPLCNKATCVPASTLQLSVFFGGLYIVALGNGGTKPNISTIGADQFDEFDPKERMHKLSFFNWHKVPQGSPFTRMARVTVAAVRKWKLPIPNDPKELHELDLEVYTEKGKFRIDSTNSIRFLNKAAVKGPSDTPWTLCSVTQVEETKQIIRMLPILTAMFTPSTMSAQVNTLFTKQGTALDRRIGPHFQIPPASLAAFSNVSLLVSVVLYDRYLVRIMRIWTKNPRGITLLQRLGVGLVIHIVVMLIASIIERSRLSVARSHGLDKTGGQVPVSIFILLPQFLLIGMADAFLAVGKIEFFYDQAPESMKSLGTSYSLTAFGAGNFLSSFLLKLVSNITSKNGKGWVLNNLNASHLDYYYGFLTILNVLNFLYFLFVSRIYSYKVELSESFDASREDQVATCTQKELNT